MLLAGVGPAGLAAAVAIGLSLGLLGGGGAILTVPALVYLVGLEAKTAIATSLVVVGVASSVGAVAKARVGHVDFGVTLRFAPAAMLGAYVGARAAVLVSGAVQLGLLAVTMLAAAGAMLRPRRTEGPTRSRSPLLLALTGLGVGLLTGVVGVGGGFLMLPALTELAAVPMAQATGTSLVVIVLNTLAASAGYAGAVPIQWGPAAVFSSAAALGAVAGTRLAGRIAETTLRRAFAGLLLALGVLMLVQRSG